MNYSDMSDSNKEKVLRDLYIDKKLSFQDIAKKFATYANRIRRDATRLKIPIRDKSEAQKNALKTGKHSHPTKGQKRSDAIKNKIGLSVMRSWDSLTESERDQRAEKAKQQWEKLSDEEKQLILASANKAVREASKRGSKLENFLLKELLRFNYRTEFHKEQMLSNTKLQIDIFLPDHNIAIEVDGPSHFSPIWGEDSLQRNKKYDNKKTGLITGKGYYFIRIKQTKDYCDTRARILGSKLMDTVQSIIDKQDITTKLFNIEDSDGQE